MRPGSFLSITAVLWLGLVAGCGDAQSVLAGGDSGLGADVQGDGTAPDDATSDAMSDASADSPEVADAPGDGAGDAGDASDASDAGDASDATPPMDVPPADVTDVPPVDVEMDVPPVDVPMDVPPVDVPPMDVTPMDIPPVDVPMDVPPIDVMMDVPPVDMGVPDVPPVDVGPTVIRGHRATSVVSAGSVMTSRSYRMVSTLGQSSITQSVRQSTRFRLRGGLVGASGGTR